VPRTIRYNEPGAVHHVISRFVAQEWFIRGDEDRQQYLRWLGHALSRSDWKCLAYAVMSNHIHLAVIAGTTPISSWLRPVHSPFAEWVNKQRDRIGAVFARGPRDWAVGASSVGRSIAYIHNNPVRAGVFSRAREGAWTSHRAYLGLDAPPAWLDVREGLVRSGFDDPDAFDRWVDTAPSKRDEVDLLRIQRAARTRGSLELGTPIVGGPDARVEVPLLATSWAHLRLDPRLVVDVTADELSISRVELCSRRRSPTIVFARGVAVLSAIQLGLTGADISAALAISSQAASVIRQRVQEDAAVKLVCERVVARLSSSGAHVRAA
jgi:hypothetical protein